MKNAVHSLLLLVILVGCAGPSEWRAYQRGRADAEQNTARGKFVLWEWGCCLPRIAASEYYTLLRERYGIEMRRDSCLDNRDRTAWRRGYNEVFSHAAETRWGTNIWAATWKDAEQLYAEKQKRR